MRRALIALAGASLGVVAGVALGGCTYFECENVDHPLLSGTYVMPGRTDYSLVLMLDGTATETFTLSSGEVVQTEYSVGPTASFPP